MASGTTTTVIVKTTNHGDMQVGGRIDVILVTGGRLGSLL
jgi:hypothetical protein